MWNGTPYTASQKDASSIDLLVDRLPGSGENGLILLSDVFSAHTQDIGILAAPSGSGKTRSVLEFLSLKWGIYFVTTTEGNGGSEDFSHVIGTVMKECRNVPDSDNEVVVWSKFSKLLYVRLLILSRLLEIKPGLTPFQWLLLQLYPNNYFGKDVFSLASSNVLNLDVGPDELNPFNYALESRINEKLFVFIDEAQEMVKKVGPFVSEKDGNGLRQQRPLFSPVSRFFKGLFKTFFVGTGIEMLKSLSWASNAMKKVKFSTEAISLGYFDASVAWDHYVGK